MCNLSEGVEQKGIQQALTESIKNLCGASEKTKINITFRKEQAAIYPIKGGMAACCLCGSIRQRRTVFLPRI